MSEYFNVQKFLLLDERVESNNVIDVPMEGQDPYLEVDNISASWEEVRKIEEGDKSREKKGRIECWADIT